MTMLYTLCWLIRYISTVSNNMLDMFITMGHSQDNVPFFSFFCCDWASFKNMDGKKSFVATIISCRVCFLNYNLLRSKRVVQSHFVNWKVTVETHSWDIVETTIVTCNFRCILLDISILDSWRSAYECYSKRWTWASTKKARDKMYWLEYSKILTFKLWISIHVTFLGHSPENDPYFFI